MTSLISTDPAVNAAAPPPPPPALWIQSIIVTAAARRRLMRCAGLPTDAADPVVIVGAGPFFPEVSGNDWHAACDELPAGMDDIATLPDIRDFVRALMSTSTMLLVDGDAESVEALHDL